MITLIVTALSWGTITAVQAQLIDKPATESMTIKQPGDSMQVWHLSYRLLMDTPSTVHLSTAKNGKIPASAKKHAESNAFIKTADLRTPALEIWVTDSLEKVESVSLLGKTTFLVRKNDRLQRQIQLDPTTQTAYLGVMGLPSVMLAGDTVIIIDPKDFSLHLTDKTDTLLHMAVKYAHFDSNTPYTNNRIAVWYTDKIPTIYWDKYSYLQELPGAAVVITVTLRKAQVGIVLSAASQVQVTKDFFEVPRDYKRVDYYQLQQADSQVDSVEQSGTTQDPPLLDQN